MTTLPRFLISSGVIANADCVMIIGAASKAAPVKSTCRRLGFESFLVSMVRLLR